MNQIHKEWCEITKTMAELKLRLSSLQYNCPHEYFTQNYDTTQDGFRIDRRCKDCGKAWSVYED